MNYLFASKPKNTTKHKNQNKDPDFVIENKNKQND